MSNVSSIKREAMERAVEWAAQQPNWWHDSGNLHPQVLEAIGNHALRINASQTAETGCGLSTVMLSTMVDSHTCFTIAAGNSLSQVQNVPLLKSAHVNFVIGPSQLTLPRHSFSSPLDLILIDGPHGFPFAHLEYFYFYQKIRKGGVLVVDDIHIPTVRQLYDVLRDEKMWRHLEDVMTTAFFERTDAPMFDPFGDGWERQQFNQRHFHSPETMDIYAPGWREMMPPQSAPLLAAGGDIKSDGASDGNVRRLNYEFERLEAENRAIKNSRSWRVTAPLRSLSKLLGQK